MTQLPSGTVQFHVFVPGIPKGQPRQRHYAKLLKDGKIFSGNYEPAVAKEWKKNIYDALVLKAPESPTLGPVAVVIEFLMPRPKAHFRTGKFKGIIKPSSPYWHTNKPDVDNLAKAVFDVMTKSGIFKDDSQICDATVSKKYAIKDSGVIIRVLSR